MKQLVFLAAIILVGVVALWACAQIVGLQTTAVVAVLGAIIGVVVAFPAFISRPAPYLLTRNTTTLQAWRAHQKAAFAFAYAQPYLAMVVVGVAPWFAAVGLVLFTRRFHHMSWLYALAPLPTLLALIVTQIRTWLFWRRHPFDPDKIAQGGPIPSQDPLS